MKHYNRIFMCLLAALLVAPTLMACSDNSSTNETTAQSNVSDTKTEEVTETTDPFADFDYEGRDFRIWTSINKAATSMGNSNYMIQGEEELTGDAAPDAAYERNNKVSELLNVTFQYAQLDKSYDLVKAEIQKYVMAGENAYELIINDMYGTASLTLEACSTTSWKGSILISHSPGGIAISWKT